MGILQTMDLAVRSTKDDQPDSKLIQTYIPELSRSQLYSLKLNNFCIVDGEYFELIKTVWSFQEALSVFSKDEMVFRNGIDQFFILTNKPSL